VSDVNALAGDWRMSSRPSRSVGRHVRRDLRIIEARHGAEGLRDLDHFIGRAGIELVPVDSEHGKLACSGFSRSGKGRHRAGLNYGDCFSYALAISAGEPLFFKGDDFVHTDVTMVDLGSR
jgi:ribonuclease VapC